MTRQFKPLPPALAMAWVVSLCLSVPLLAEEYVEDLTHWPVLTLQRALERGLSSNLDLRIESISMQISEENQIAEDANFDPTIDASVSAQTQKTPTSSAFSEDAFSLQRTYAGEAGLSKMFRFGLDSRLAWRSSRVSDNSTIEGLAPQYRSFLVLDLTQPLLRDFGVKTNTTNLRIAETRVRQATISTIDRAQSLAAQIENAYYVMAQAIQVYGYRIESRELAHQLLDGNSEKFASGLIPITEVQEAETAVASRDEQVLTARQDVEMAGNRIKSLLEINNAGSITRDFFRTDPLAGIDQPFPSLDEALALALHNRCNLEQQRLEIIARDIRLEFDTNQTLPRLDLDATFGVNGLSGEGRSIEFVGYPSSDSPQTGSYADSLERLAQGDGYEWFAGVNFSYPLGNREAKARQRRSDLEKKQAIYGLKRLETTVETEVIDGLIAVNRSLERVKVASRFEVLAQTTLHQEMERLREGLSDTFRILDFQDKVIDARLRKVTALGDFNRGLANLHRAMGTNLERLNIVYKTQNREFANEAY